MLVATDDVMVSDIQVTVAANEPSLVMGIPLADLGGAARSRLMSGLLSSSVALLRGGPVGPVRRPEC